MNIIISGASKGIGFELIRAYAQNSGNKVVGLSRNINPLIDLLNNTSNVWGYNCDINSATDLKVVYEKVKDSLGHVDLIINNAGILVNKPFMELSEKDDEIMMQTNFHGPIRVIRTFMALLERSSKPAIFNIGSMGGFQGTSKFPGLSVYSASKAALACLSECLAVELAEKGVTVNCLALGAVNTEMLQQAFPGYNAPVNAVQMADFIQSFVQSGGGVVNGQVIPVAYNSP